MFIYYPIGNIHYFNVRRRTNYNPNTVPSIFITFILLLCLILKYNYYTMTSCQINEIQELKMDLNVTNYIVYLGVNQGIIYLNIMVYKFKL